MGKTLKHSFTSRKCLDKVLHRNTSDLSDCAYVLNTYTKVFSVGYQILSFYIYLIFISKNVN